MMTTKPVLCTQYDVSSDHLTLATTLYPHSYTLLNGSSQGDSYYFKEKMEQTSQGFEWIVCYIVEEESGTMF